MASVVREAYDTVVRFVNERVLRRAPAVETSTFTIETASEPRGLAKGRSVNLYTEGWAPVTGTTRVPRYTFGITFIWTDNAGVDHECQRTLIFPDALLELGVEEIQDRVQEWLIEIARAQCGVDE